MGALAGASMPMTGTVAAESAPVVPLALLSTAGPLIEQVVDLLGATAGVSWQKHRVPWGRVLSMCERGEALAFGLSRQQASAAPLAWSEPVLKNRIWMVVRDEALLKVRFVEDLKGHSLCVSRGFSYGPEFEEAQGRAFKVEVADGGYEARLRMLKVGRCDVVLTSQLSGQWQVVSRRLGQLAIASPDMRVVPTPLYTEDVHFAVNGSSPLASMLPGLNRAVATQKARLETLVNT